MTAPRAREQRRPPAPPDGRRGLLRSAWVLAAAACLALVGALALPATAEAQTDVLVSNLGQTESGGGSALSATSLAAQSFSVPSGGGNYTLTSIEIVVDLEISFTNIGFLTVSVWSADSLGQPASSLQGIVKVNRLEPGRNAS